MPPIRDDDSAFCGITTAPALTPGGGPGTFRRPVWTALLSVLSCNGSRIGGRGFRPEGAEAASERAMRHRPKFTQEHRRRTRRTGHGDRFPAYYQAVRCPGPPRSDGGGCVHKVGFSSASGAASRSFSARAAITVISIARSPAVRKAAARVTKRGLSTFPPEIALTRWVIPMSSPTTLSASRASARHLPAKAVPLQAGQQPQGGVKPSPAERPARNHRALSQRRAVVAVLLRRILRRSPAGHHPQICGRTTHHREPALARLRLVSPTRKTGIYGALDNRERRSRRRGRGHRPLRSVPRPGTGPPSLRQ